MTDKDPTDTTDAKDPSAEPGGGKSPSLMRELWDFVCHNKKWWLIPIIVALLLVGILILLTANKSIAPFIYTLV